MPEQLRPVTTDEQFPSSLESTHHVEEIGTTAITQGIRGWGKVGPEQEGADFNNPDIAFIGTHADDYQRFYGVEPATTDNQRERAKQIIEAADQRKLWNELGFKAGQFAVSPLQQGFSKENNPDFAHRTGSQFHVVEDGQGTTYLLKAAAGDRQLREAAASLETVWAAQTYAESDRMASRVGQYMGYPVVPTELVEYKDKPYVAYGFIKDAMNADETDMIKNKGAAELRQVFNFVAGSFGDAAHQGIVDPSDGNYYANDLTMVDTVPQVYGHGPVTTWKEFMDRKLADPNYAPWTIGALPTNLDAETAQTLSGYVGRLRGLDIETAKEVLDAQTPLMQGKLDVLANGLAERAQVIVNLYEQGYFAGQPQVA